MRIKRQKLLELKEFMIKEEWTYLKSIIKTVKGLKILSKREKQFYSDRET
jgi:hypothetical protein